MCGILFLQGPEARKSLPIWLDRLRHRGPDDDAVWLGDGMALGFTRLAINGSGLQGRQPYHHGRFVGAINGEIYNHRELAAFFGLDSDQECDTRVVLPLFEKLGSRVIDHLDGFFSAVVVDRDSGEIFCLRDHMGKKPLFVGETAEALFITSELKALDEIVWFETLPKGVSRVKPDTGQIIPVSRHHEFKPTSELRRLMADAVRKRMPMKEQPVGLFLSGGLDSSIVALLTSQLRDDIVYYTLGNQNSPDVSAVKVLVDALGLKDVRFVSRPSSEELPELVERVVYATESYNPSVISNGLSTFLLAEAARRDGIKVVLSGEGADELFGGYHVFREDEPWRETRRQLVDDMHFTELRRLDLSTMAHGVEARCPFLDRTIRAFSDQLGYSDLYAGSTNKVILRRVFEGHLPAEIVQRPKTSFDVGSGIRGQIVAHLRRNGRSEREELKTLWRRLFRFDSSQGYFHRYPVFDHLIDKRGAEHR